ncbi:hypothetical protein O6H91_Y094600 [Diphasiastrum complanatum]|nr:hypothetical protein O6H91_Y094600 [Diphasiastrum complanatum]
MNSLNSSTKLKLTLPTATFSAAKEEHFHLVIVNVSDHFTRIKAHSGVGTIGSWPHLCVYGCVIEIQSGRTVEILNSFELQYDPDLDSIHRPFLELKQEQYRKVFPKYDILGWYSTGSDALMNIDKSPIYVLLNPAINHAQKDLSVTIFESGLHVIDGVPSMIFVRSAYTIETVEAEHISVDHVAHIKPSDGSSAATQLAAHLTGMHNVIKMLNSRIKFLHNLLSAIQKGEAPYEHALLRQIFFRFEKETRHFFQMREWMQRQVAFQLLKHLASLSVYEQGEIKQRALHIIG